MKYKVVGIINLILGASQIIFPLIFLLFTLPKLGEVYSDLNTGSYSFIPTYFMLGLNILLGIASLLSGFKLFRGTGNKDRYFKFGLTLIILGIFLSGFLMAAASLSVIMPLYSLTSQI